MFGPVCLYKAELKFEPNSKEQKTILNKTFFSELTL